MPHSFPDGELAGVFRSPCASSQTTPRRPWRDASPSDDADVRAAAAAEHERPLREIAGDGEGLGLERLLLDDGGLRIVERQARRLDHRLAAVAPGARDANEAGREGSSTGVALVVGADRHGGVRPARRALGT
jgi:hypothetical protein